MDCAPIPAIIKITPPDQMQAPINIPINCFTCDFFMIILSLLYSLAFPIFELLWKRIWDPVRPLRTFYSNARMLLKCYRIPQMDHKQYLLFLCCLRLIVLVIPPVSLSDGVWICEVLDKTSHFSPLISPICAGHTNHKQSLRVAANNLFGQLLCNF